MIYLSEKGNHTRTVQIAKSGWDGWEYRNGVAEERNYKHFQHGYEALKWLNEFGLTYTLEVIEGALLDVPSES